MPGLPSISVVICAYTLERWDDLCSAVEGVRKQTLPAREILVVVDHNRELWRKAIDELRGATVLENAGARGLSGARNSGIAAARSDVIAFMDEDAVPDPDWLERLAAGYGASGLVLGVGGSVEPWWQAGRPAWFPEEFDWVVGCTYRGMPVAASQVRNLIGCNMSLRRSVFAALGGFRDGIGRIGAHPVGCEETELCIRARQRWPDGKLIFQPLARVSHRVPATRGTWRYFLSRCYFEGRSKALVTRLTGSQMGLASERSYALRALPHGVWRNTLTGLRLAQPGALLRSAAICVGLAYTVVGFAVGRVLAARERRSRPNAAEMPRAEEARALHSDVT